MRQATRGVGVRPARVAVGVPSGPARAAVAPPLAPLREGPATPTRAVPGRGSGRGAYRGEHRHFDRIDDLTPVLHEHLSAHRHDVVLRQHPSPEPLAYRANVSAADRHVNHHRSPVVGAGRLSHGASRGEG